MKMKKVLISAFGLTVLSAFAGWNGAGVPGGTVSGNINDTANWTVGVINGDFSTITLPGPTALVLTDNLTFTNGTPVTTTATVSNNLTQIVLADPTGVSVGQVVVGAGIRYNTVLIGVNDNIGVLSQAASATAINSSYTFTRQALNFDFGVRTLRATNVVVTLDSDTPGTLRTLTLSGRILQTQTTPAGLTNEVMFSTNIAFSLTDQAIVTRETGAINSGTIQPRLTINGPLDLGSSSGIQRLLLAGGDMTVNGVVSGAGSLINVGAATEAGRLTLTNPDNSYSGGNTTSGFGSPFANSTRVLANTGSNSALGSAGRIGLDNIKLTLQGFTTPQITDRPWNVGSSISGGAASLDNNGAAPVALTGTLANLLAYTAPFYLGGTYQNDGTPNVLSGSISNGVSILGIYVSRGVWLLNNAANTFTGSASVGGSADGATLQFTSVANMGVASSLGAGTTVNLQGAGAGNVNFLEYVGTNNATGNRLVNITGNVSGTGGNGNNTILANGLGSLELSGVISNSLTPNVVNAQTRALFLGGLGSGKLSGQGALGDITNGSNIARVSIYKVGTGSWTLSGSNFNYQGETEIRAGNLILDYTSYDQFPGTTSGIVRTDGGTLTFKGKPAGTTSDTLPVLLIGNGAKINRSSTVVLDANHGNGFKLTVNQLEGDGQSQKFDLIDLSSSAGNTLTVNALGSILKAVNNGVLMNVTGTRATLVVHTATNYGFAALSGVTSGTLQPLSGQTPLPVSGYANTANYILNTPGTVTPTVDLVYSTLTMDTTAGARSIELGAKKIGTLDKGRGILVYGLNDATISGTGTASHVSATSIWFHNYLDTNATLNVSANLGATTTLTWGGPGFTVYTGTGLGTFFCQGGGVFRMATAQTVSLPSGEFALADGSVFEIGADLNGAAAGDFSYALGTGNGKFSLYGNSGLSAAGANRTVNFGGASATLTWGSNGFLTYAESTADYGYKLMLSSAKANATLEIQNPIDLNGNSNYGRRRTVDVANGSAAVDARLSGALSGNAALVKSGAGTLELTGAQTYDGPLMVMGGTLRVGAANIFSNTLAVQLRGGGLSAASGTNTLGRLELYTDSVIDAGDGTASLAFADSSASVWGGTLTINGRLGPASLRFGTDAYGLTPSQLAAINNRGAKVALDANGYLRRVPAGTVIFVR